VHGVLGPCRQEGHILLDGVDIREYNVAWLRARMGLVAQEPTLFCGSIADNIAYGKPTRQPGILVVRDSATVCVS
jgi:ABC-type multidrug transport system fused ATPase/permease subunit